MAVVTRKAHHPLFYDLVGIAGAKYVSDDDFTVVAYSKDAGPLPPNKQGIVVRPGSIQEVVDIVNLANTAKNPIVVSGGRAGYYGTPKGLHGKGIVVDMTRIRKLIKIDEENLVVSAEAGMTTSELSTYVWEKGWDVHTAFQPFFSDTLGGQLSGFAGGGNGLEMTYAGFNATHVAGIKVVIPDGTIVSTGAGEGNNLMNKGIQYDRYPGTPDITGLFMGDAGTFGIKVEASYKMYKIVPHEQRKIVCYAYPTYEKAWEVNKDLSEIEPLPIYINSIIAPTAYYVNMGMPDKYFVIVAAKGCSVKETEAKMEVVEEIMVGKHGGESIAMVKEWIETSYSGERLRQMGELSSHGTWNVMEYYCSRSQVLECREVMKEYIYGKCAEFGIPEPRSQEILVSSLAHSWIVSFFIYLDGQDLKAQAFMQQLFADATDLAASHGWYGDCHQGWMTRCVARHWPKEKYEFMRKIKRTLDPNNIMNPGIWDF